MNVERVTRALGWFSIALGVSELVAGPQMSRWLGMRRGGLLLRIYGLREIAAGVGILGMRRKAPWLWARVGGDAMDLATLGLALAKTKRNRGRAAAAIGAVAGVTALDILSGRGSRSPVN